MKFSDSKVVGREQILLVQCELAGKFFVAVERIDNYTFSPHYVSKTYKTKKSAKKLFNKMLNKYHSVT